MPSRTDNRAKAKVLSLLNAGKHEEAGVRARGLCEQYPDDFECHLFLGIALMDEEKYEKARKVLVRAVEKFPEQWKLRMVLGHVHGHQGDWRRSEEAYRKALDDAKDASAQEVAELHCSVAEALWAQHHRDGALAEWRRALEVDPECEEAQESLKERTNEYGEPRAPSAVFDDLYHFRRIQTERYFRIVGRNEFVSKEEAETVVGVIMAGWNDSIALAHRKLIA